MLKLDRNTVHILYLLTIKCLLHVNVSKANQAIIIKQPTAKVRKYYYVSLPEVICNDR